MNLEPLKVLLVEDNPGDARLVQEMLAEQEQTAFTLERADRLSTGLERLASGGIALVLLDLSLPDSQGLDTFVRMHAHVPCVPIIVLTGLDDEILALEAVRKGAQDYLVKGQVDGPLLARALRYAVERKRAETALERRTHELADAARDNARLYEETRSSRDAVLNMLEDLEETARQLRARNEQLFAAEKALRESEARLRRIFETMNEGVVWIAPDGQITYANPAAERILGLERSAIESRTYLNPAWEVLRPDGTPMPPEERVVSRAMKEKRPIKDMEMGIRRPDGTIVWITVSAAPLLEEAGQVQGVVASFADVTERKQLEQQFHQAQKMEAVGRLAGGVAHDFNNLLTIVGGYSELLLRRLSADQPHYASVQEIQKAADRGAGLIRQLLAFSRKQVLEPVVLNLNTVVRDLEKMLRRLIGEDVELVVALAPDLGQVKADPGQLEQVLMNLATNARDAMPRGGRLTIKTSNAELDAAYATNHVAVKPGPYALLEVSDTGVGMDAQIQAQIFEPFFTTKEQDKGTGLGLSTVHGIVKQSEGYIWVYSELGQGTSFKIYLPRVEEEATPAVQATAALAAGGSETVLLVEDEAPLRGLMAVLLRQAGYTVLEAGQGEEALGLAAQHQGAIHLVVTDMVMPGMGGRELVRQLSAAQPRLKTLYISGYSAEVVERQGSLAPGALFLQKPFKANALLLKVRQALGREG